MTSFECEKIYKQIHFIRLEIEKQVKTYEQNDLNKI